MPESMQSWSIIILCYNEAESILKVVEESFDWLGDYAFDESEIILINDGSEDESGIIIDQFIKGNPSKNIVYINHKENLGIGASLKEGYLRASQENVVMIPGDDQFDLNELNSYCAFEVDEFIAFYRSKNEEYSPFRKALSKANRKLNKHLLGLQMNDVNWVKAYKTQAIQAIDFAAQSSLIETEICAKLIKQGLSPVEVQSKYLARTSGESKGASWRILKQAILDLPRLYLELSKK
jgi:glycosyltransferase involved in cell wall biosynthesis